MNFDLTQLRIEGEWYAGIVAAGVIPLWLSGLRRELGMYIALITIGLVLYHFNHDFLSASNVSNTGRQTAMLVILAIGSAYVIVTGGIDLSAGSVVGLTGVIIAYCSSPTRDHPQPLWQGITIAMIAALLVGLIQGTLITGLSLQPFIVTLGVMLTLRGVSQTLVDGGNISFGDSVFPHLADAGLWVHDDIPYVPYIGLIAVVAIVIAAYVLHFTVFGRHLYAIGGNRDAAQYSGIPVAKRELSTYIISAGMAGVAGVCYAAYIQQMNQNVGVSYELTAIAACVLGGFSLRGGEGTIFGVIIGAAMLNVIENSFDVFRIPIKDSQGVDTFWRPNENWRFIVRGMVILLAVILDQLVHMYQQRRRTRAIKAAA